MHTFAKYFPCNDETNQLLTVVLIKRKAASFYTHKIPRWPLISLHTEIKYVVTLLIHSKLKTDNVYLSNVYPLVSKVTVQILLLIILNIKCHIFFVTFHFYIIRQGSVFVRNNIHKSGVALPSWFHQCYGASGVRLCVAASFVPQFRCLPHQGSHLYVCCITVKPNLITI